MGETFHRQSWFEFIARIGLSARAVVYLTVAGLLLWGGLLSGGWEDGASPSDAFRQIEEQPWGWAILYGLAAGLLMYSVWRVLQAVFDTGDEGDDATGWLARAGMVSSGLSYFLIAVASASIAMDAPGSGDSSTRETVSWLLRQPFGSLLVMLAGLALAGVGGAQIWRARERQWKDSLTLKGWGKRLETVAGCAIAGRGVLFILGGLSVAYAGFATNPDKALGLAATLGWLREQPYGLALYLLAALAIGGYGVYCVLQARFTDFD
ncbi:MAG: DUF1206 domain-containing protein [Pseudomonadota bacterium]